MMPQRVQRKQKAPKKYTQYQRRKHLKEIKSLNTSLTLSQAALANTQSRLRSARDDAFSEFAERSEMLKTASAAIGQELGKMMAVKIAEPLWAALRHRELKFIDIDRLAREIARILGPDFYNVTLQTFKEMRYETELPVVDFALSEIQWEKAYSVLTGTIPALSYSVQVKA